LAEDPNIFLMETLLRMRNGSWSDRGKM